MSKRSLMAIAVGCVAAVASILILPARPATSWHEPFSPSLVTPSGPEHVGLRATRFDTGNDDPWRPGEDRVIMVDVRYPAADGEYPLRYYARSQHMSELAMLAWAPDQEKRLGLLDGEVNWLFVTHSLRWAPPRPGSYPVVVIGAPPGSMRSSHTALAEDLASHGFVVVTVDHPYDAPSVELWPTRKVIEPTDAARRLDHVETQQARETDLAAVADDVTHLDEEVAPVMAAGCTFVVSGALADRAVRLTDDALVEAQIARDSDRVTVAEATLRQGRTDFRRALIQQWQRDDTCIAQAARGAGGS